MFTHNFLGVPQSLRMPEHALLASDMQLVQASEQSKKTTESKKIFQETEPDFEI